jgi:biotin carboxyl carrier protein
MSRRYTIDVAGEIHEVLLAADGRSVQFTFDGRARAIELGAEASGGVSTWRDGNRVVEAFVDGALPRLPITIAGTTIIVEIADARLAASTAATAAGRRSAGAPGPLRVRAPMPGRVTKIAARVGEAVSAGQCVLVIEAMKMENEIRAPRAAVVREIRCAEGQSVEAGQDLALLD